MEDHIHILISLPSILSISAAIKLFKGSSSRWIHQTFPELTEFTWQEGYGAFSVSRSLREKTINYIANQIEHHKRLTSEEEFEILRRKNLD
ncbi:MAG: transposase [bacterium]|nr:transposase [bacterium]